VRFGVITFPGTCDDRDALLACSRVGDALSLWHGDRDLGHDRREAGDGADAQVVAVGEAAGDDDGVDVREVAAFAARGGPVLGICNGFQVLCEAGLLPGALLPNTSLRFSMRQTVLEVQRSNSIWTRACEPGTLLSIPAKHTTGRYYAPQPVLDEMEAQGQVVLRYTADPQPNGSLDAIAGVSNAAGNVLGLMPHPEHAVDVLNGSADGLRLFESVALAAAR